MRSRSWLILSIGFGTLVLLIGLLGFGAMRRAQTLHDQTVSAHAAYLRTDAVLREIPADLYLSDILIRDYLLDPSQIAAPAYREQLLTWRSSIRQRLDLLAQRLGDADDVASLRQLRTELRGYWESMDPILSWSSEEKFAFSRSFLRQQVLPRREAVVALAREISEINAANLRKEQQRLQGSQELFQSFLRRTVL
ncbi:MAG: MCP four helix bundle domain-containing protein, partial [Acidobacteria bacterium]|nr:MCP four helix bundle domain-containing protein [Acidobacteriota bacterium]